MANPHQPRRFMSNARQLEFAKEIFIPSTSTSRNPSEQQSAIVQMAKAPGIGSCCRITAAAGTGKTTTLELMSSELLKKGHLSNNVCYLTFNKTAVADAKLRLSHHVLCKTLHSCAFEFIKVDYKNFYPMDDTTLESQIGIICSRNIENFLRNMPLKDKRDHQINKRTIKTVSFNIRKTVETFLTSKKTVAKGFDPTVFGTTYLPALNWHKGQGRQALPHGLEVKQDNEIKQFYTENAKLVWDAMNKPSDGSAPKINTFDSILKRVQLLKRGFKLIQKCTAYLLDESQDCNECQLDLVCSQVHQSTLLSISPSAL
jgi:superfamily I DNA/RNA helicase